MSESVIIAGGGLAGVLAALRCHRKFPDKQITLVEQQSQIGGLLGGDCEKNPPHLYGMNMVGKRLTDFMKQSLHPLNIDPEAMDEIFIPIKLGILSANNFYLGVSDNFASKDLMKKIAGLKAAKKFEQLFNDLLNQPSEVNQNDGKSDFKAPLSKVWKESKKSGPGILLEHLGNCLGIHDVWTCDPEALIQRYRQFESGAFFLDWQRCLNCLKATEAFSDIKWINNTLILEQKINAEGRVQLKTQSGEMSADQLIVAMNLWDASQWMEQKDLPVSCLGSYNHTQPTSCVSLSFSLPKEGKDLFYGSSAHHVYIPAENTVALVWNGNVSFRNILPYEFSLDAPNVLKSIKRLKRAKKKWLQALDAHLQAQAGEDGEENQSTSGQLTQQMDSIENFVALSSFAFPQSPSFSDRRYVQKYDALEKGYDKPIKFCGVGIGSSYDLDRNFIASLCDAAANTKSDSLKPSENIDLDEKEINNTSSLSSQSIEVTT